MTRTLPLGLLIGTRSRVARTTLALLLLSLLAGSPTPSFAQIAHDTDGREFWVAFMENWGSREDFERSDMRMYAACDSATTVRVIYSATNDTLVVRLDIPNVPVEIDVDTWFGEDSELPGVFDDGSNAITRRSFHVVADHEITLYGINIRNKSSDAYLALPDDVLTGTYLVLAWQNGLLQGEVNGIFISDFERHSEFAVIATEDGTTVRITPSVLLMGQESLKSFTVVLDRGEVYFGQARLGLELDVTGSVVQANKPVAVIAGNQRTSVPTQVGNYRDHLVEQMPPIQAWGTTAVLTPHFTIDPRSPYQAEARILAAFDSTTVQIVDGVNGSTRTVLLSAGSFYRLSPLVATFVRADKPILAAQYEHSVGSNNFEGPTYGDPFMMIIPPPEQYDTAYAFQSVIHPEFIAHYINIIIPSGSEGSLRIDGRPLLNARFVPVVGTPYVYAQVEVSAGSHYIRAGDRFGLCVYGFGDATSYGYIGGSLFRELVVDFERPTMVIDDGCPLINGTTFERGLTDSGIDSLFTTDETHNMLVTIDDFIAGADSVAWSARLIDPYRDGVVALKSVDRAGRSTTIEKKIPGFTVETVGMLGGAPVETSVVSFNGTESCQEIELVNYGGFSQTIDQIGIMPDTVAGFRIDTDLPIVLLPGERKTITVCFTAVPESSTTLTLGVGNGCAVRTVSSIVVAAVIDTLAPEIGLARGSCGTGSEITIVEEDRPHLGVATITIDTIRNGRATILPTPLPAQQASIRLEPIDFREDLTVQATIRDRAGNEVVVRDTIGGFTLAVHEVAESEQLAIRLDAEWTGDALQLLKTRCDSLTLVNYGSRELLINRAFMFGNAEFSIPPSQLPFYLAPGSSIRFAVCLQGREAGDQIDTLWLEDGCGRWESVRLKTVVTTVEGSGLDACGQLIAVQSSGGAKRTFLSTVMPNPAPPGDVAVDLGLEADERIAVDIVDLSGRKRLHVLDEDVVPAGLYRLRFPLDGLDAGSYLCVLHRADGRTISTTFVVDR